MTDHECKHEVDLALVAVRIDQILTGQNEMKAAQKEVLSIIFGNGKEGINTKIARNRDAIKRQWYAVGIIIAGLAGLAIKSLI